MTEAPTPAELAAWCAVGSVPSAVGRSRLEVRGGSFGWATFGPPPALVDVPDGAGVAFWYARPGKWRMEVDGALLAVADGERAAAWTADGVRVGPALLCPGGPTELLEPGDGRLDASGTVERDDVLGRAAWRWDDGEQVRWVDEATGVLLRRANALGVVELTALEVGADVPPALFEVPDVPAEQVHTWLDLGESDPHERERPTAGFAVPWWPGGCGGWPVAGDPAVPEVLLALSTSDGSAWYLGIAPDGHEPRQHGAPVRTWTGDGWRFALSCPAGVPADELERVVASVPGTWR